MWWKRSGSLIIITSESRNSRRRKRKGNFSLPSRPERQARRPGGLKTTRIQERYSTASSLRDPKLGILGGTQSVPPRGSGWVNQRHDDESRSLTHPLPRG